MNVRRAIGIGCSTHARVDDVLALVRATVDELTPATRLATLDRCEEIALVVAADLGLALIVFPADVLARVLGTTTHSQRAAATVGTPSVAEAAALAAAGPGARLVITRRTGLRCTCALAEAS